jgi:RNA polymerase sigma factor (sigma-70 family)
MGQPVVARSRRKRRPGSDVVQAAARIFEEHGGFIRAIIRFQIQDKSEEEDFFQGFFLALIFRSVPAEVHNLRSYLYRAVTNYIRDSVRRRVCHVRALKKYAEEGGIAINNRPPENVLIEETEEQNVIVACFARHLQQRQAEAFVLRYRDNCSVGEIAAKMGVTARTVSRYLSESLKTLRRMLAT